MNQTLIALLSLGALGATFALVLAIGSRVFAVEIDPTVEQIDKVLPGVNCGACGYAGCHSFAENVAQGKAKPNGCPVGGSALAEAIGEILGVEAGVVLRNVAQVLCKGGQQEAKQRSSYEGPLDCRVVHLTSHGDKACIYGCLGYGTCVFHCAFQAMVMNENGLPVIMEERCTACGQCVKACPRGIIQLTGEAYGVHIRCRSFAKGKEVRETCQVGCIGCRRCVKECPVQAIYVENNLAYIDYEKCIVCGKCSHVCPMKTIVVQEGKPPLQELELKE